VDKVLFNPLREFELASCSSDGVRFWDTRSRSCVAKVQVDGDPFTLAWSTDGSVLLAGTKVTIRNIVKGTQLMCSG
jgi:THO complex subunit 3